MPPYGRPLAVRCVPQKENLEREAVWRTIIRGYPLQETLYGPLLSSALPCEGFQNAPLRLLSLRTTIVRRGV